MLKNTVALTVAGSDSGGGAGIQADIKTFSACGVYAASVVTAVTAQNLEGVRAIQGIQPEMVEEQLRAVLEGYPVKAAKTGMLFSRAIVDAVADVFAGYRHIPIVVDPVFAATSGGRLIKPGTIRVLSRRLFPLAALVTPNVPEAEYLLGRELLTVDDLREAGQDLFRRYGVPFLMKGGHLPGAADRKSASPRVATIQEAVSARAATIQEAVSPWGTAVDLLVDGRGVKSFSAEAVRTVNSHGSGCTFSAAIAAYLARGRSLPVAVGEAKLFITASLRRPHYLRPGLRVINHFGRQGKLVKR
jgi:hydroxymethylpyrimidine/phosphomethylpyrimidine kinase